MLKNLLNEDDDVIITELSIESIFVTAADKISETLKVEFSNSILQLYNIERLNKGLSHPIHVISIKSPSTSSSSEKLEDYFTLRILEKNDDQNPDYYDRALDQKRRMIKIQKLDRFYPALRMLETKWFIIFLQEFLFSSIAKFDTQEEISELVNLVVKASEEGLLLDYNQNHFLFDNQRNMLFYVDKDYIEDKMEHNRAFKDNFNQALVYLEKNNVDYCKIALLELSMKYQKQIILILKNNLEKFSLRKKPSKKALEVKKLQQNLLNALEK